MKTTTSRRSILLAAGALCAFGAPQFAFAQPQAPVAADAATPKAKKPKKARDEKKPRDKKLTPRVIAATETAMGKPLTPELIEVLNASLRERDEAVKAANDAYHVRFAQVTGLTPEQAKEIDKPARKGANGAKGADGADGANGVETPTKPKVEGKTNMDELTDEGADAPVTP